MDRSNPKDLEYVGGIKVRSEEVGYSPAELVKCARCGRANAPDKANCIYCGSAAADRRAGASEHRIELLPLEAWESGFNVVLRTCADGADLRTAATLLGRETAAIERAAKTDSHIPVARLGSKGEAEALTGQLERCGLDAIVVSDVELRQAEPNIRLRGIEFDVGTITATDFNTLDRISAPAAGLMLIVCGTIHESRSESIEQAKKKGHRKSLSNSETGSDLRVMDVYFEGLSRGWQIRSNGFDFSCLGDAKGMLAAENLDRLKQVLLASGSRAQVLDDHDDVRGLIAEVWPDEVRKDFEGIKHAGLWKAGFSKKVISNNFEQFNRYSRLQRLHR
ncbi:MAG: hypothetical protein IPM25_17505 [Chloracidobacterium sp.]|nr:hypothetical protein [Chloracidobacterium sp.]